MGHQSVCRIGVRGRRESAQAHVIPRNFRGLGGAPGASDVVFQLLQGIRSFWAIGGDRLGWGGFHHQARRLGGGLPGQNLLRVSNDRRSGRVVDDHLHAAPVTRCGIVIDHLFRIGGHAVGCGLICDWLGRWGGSRPHSRGWLSWLHNRLRRRGHLGRPHLLLSRRPVPIQEVQRRHGQQVLLLGVDLLRASLLVGKRLQASHVARKRHRLDLGHGGIVALGVAVAVGQLELVPGDGLQVGELFGGQGAGVGGLGCWRGLRGLGHRGRIPTLLNPMPILQHQGAAVGGGFCVAFLGARLSSRKRLGGGLRPFLGGENLHRWDGLAGHLVLDDHRELSRSQGVNLNGGVAFTIESLQWRLGSRLRSSRHRTGLLRQHQAG